MPNPSPQIKARQSGVALITGLIFMVVMTIIVIAALRSATLEERMAANARNRQVALQAAEAVLRDAEISITDAAAVAAPFDPFTPSLFKADCTGGYCNKPAAGAAPRWQDADIWDAANSREGTTAIDGVSAPPRYIVEIVNTPVLIPGQACPKVLYRITARGLGQDNSTVFVQTMVRHMPANC
jgi:type IV pilus assembly protein PilX